MTDQSIVTLTHDYWLFFNAIHEAGHAVAASKFKIPFEDVSVVPIWGHSDGGIAILDSDRARRVYTMRKGEVVGPGAAIQNHIVTLFAGYSANDNWFDPGGGKPTQREKRESNDFFQAKWMVNKYVKWQNAAGRSSLLLKLQKKADRLVLKERGWIKRVADTLCYRKKIGPETVRALQHSAKILLPDGKSEITWHDEEPFLRIDGKLADNRVFVVSTDGESEFA